MGGSYTLAHRHLAETLRAAFPQAQGLHKALVVSAFLAAGADLFWTRRARTIPSEADTYREMAAWWRQKADELERERTGPGPSASAQQQAQQVVVNVNLASATPSRYLTEEGATADTDCFACATAHLAGMEGALRRAARVAEERGSCDDECQRWLHLAAQEPAALLARDWTPQKHAKLPPEQRRVVESFEPRIRDLQRRLLDGPALEQREALVEGTVLLKEATRFTSAGDPLDHPEVQPRIADAVSDLAAAERLQVGVWDDELATRLRRVRQQASRPETPDQLVEAAREADAVSLEANRQVFAGRSPAELRQLADEVRRLRDEFNTARRQQPTAMLGPSTRHRGESHQVPRHVVDRFTTPTEQVVEAVTDRENLARAYDNLETAIEGRGTRVRYRNLPSTEDVTLFGLYDPTSDTMLLDSFTKTARDSFAFQVLAHETAHALVDGPSCRGQGYQPGLEYSEQPSEIAAQTASLAAMLELGLPVELADGTELPPGERLVDWRKVEAVLGTDAAADTRWAAEWIARAARGEDSTLLREICPARR